MKILVVGYDAEITALTGKILERNGYGITLASCISEAETLIGSKNFCLVVAELDNDETERIRFCKTIKAMHRPPKLFLVGRSGEEEIPMLNAGADDWIKKPYKTAVFLARVSALMRQYKNIV